MKYTNYLYENGYGLDTDEYEHLIDLCYGFEEYYYYHNYNCFSAYKKVIKLLNDARNKKLNNNLYHALLGWYILFKTSKRYFSGSDFAFSLTDACQLKCKHCYNQLNSRDNKFISFDRFADVISNQHEALCHKFVHCSETKPSRIYLLGGEPTLHPELDRFIRYINDLDIAVMLETNGIKFDKTIADTIKRYARNKVIVSVDGLEKSHNIIRGEGTFQKTLSNIEKYRSMNIPVTVNTAANSLNCTDIPKMKDFFSQYNVSCHAAKYIDKGDDIIHPMNKEQCITCGITHIGRRCNVGEQVIYDYNGNGLPCGKSSLGPMFLYEDDIETKFEKVKRFVLKVRSVPTYCHDCKKVSTCLGGEMCSNFNKEHKHNLPDTICKLFNYKEKTDMFYIDTPF